MQDNSQVYRALTSTSIRYFDQHKFGVPPEDLGLVKLSFVPTDKRRGDGYNESVLIISCPKFISVAGFAFECKLLCRRNAADRLSQRTTEITSEHPTWHQ